MASPNSTQYKAEIKANEFNHHSYGLHYTLHALIGNQIETGNKWMLPANSYIKQALHDDNALNTFIHFNTTHATLWPDCSPVNWFQAVFGVNNDSTCTPNAQNNMVDYCMDNFVFPKISNELDEIDDVYLKGEYAGSAYGNELAWMLKNSIYRKAENNAALLADSLVQAIYNEAAAGYMGSLYTMDNEKNEWYINDSLANWKINFNDSLAKNISKDIDIKLINLATKWIAT
ncbi:MAG: hypothetical protein IPO27_15435 [Bacteroidetes bacterium]|nr:hypothetical protein [Bacteroidota bacterium]